MDLVDPKTKMPLQRLGHCMVAADGVSWPINDDIPILFADLVWRTEASDRSEALAEQGHYNSAATDAVLQKHHRDEVRRVVGLQRAGRLGPFGDMTWLDATYDSQAQQRAFRFVGELTGLRVLQIGGNGLQAVKALVNGASEAVLATPMESEARHFLELSQLSEAPGAAEAVVGIAEELPFADGSFEAVLMGGSLHHTVVADAISEITRVLTPGGRFGAWDPWRAPLYRIGTSLLGKREPDVHCKPLDWSRTVGLCNEVRLERYSPLLRYGLLALMKAGLEPSLQTVNRLFRWEDRILRGFGWSGAGGSSAAVLLATPSAD